MIDRAFAHISRLGLIVSAPILISEGLSSTCLGLTKAGKIYLSEALFSNGQIIVTGTILEEHLHISNGFQDMTRNFQNHLINMLATVAEHLHQTSDFSTTEAAPGCLVI